MSIAGPVLRDRGRSLVSSIGAASRRVVPGELTETANQKLLLAGGRASRSPPVEETSDIRYGLLDMASSRLLVVVCCLCLALVSKVDAWQGTGDCCNSKLSKKTFDALAEVRGGRITV